MEVLIPRGYGYQCPSVAHRNRSDNGKLRYSRNSDPILDTRVYEAVFSGVEGVKVSANRVAESILNSCDTKSNEFIFFRKIYIIGLMTQPSGGKTVHSLTKYSDR